MVKLEEVLDEEFTRDQPVPDGEEDWDTDDGASKQSPFLSRSTPKPG